MTVYQLHHIVSLKCSSDAGICFRYYNMVLLSNNVHLCRLFQVFSRSTEVCFALFNSKTSPLAIVLLQHTVPYNCHLQRTQSPLLQHNCLMAGPSVSRCCAETNNQISIIHEDDFHVTFTFRGEASASFYVTI